MRTSACNLPALAVVVCVVLGQTENQQITTTRHARTRSDHPLCMNLSMYVDRKPIQHDYITSTIKIAFGYNKYSYFIPLSIRLLDITFLHLMQGFFVFALLIHFPVRSPAKH